MDLIQRYLVFQVSITGKDVDQRKDTPMSDERLSSLVLMASIFCIAASFYFSFS
jgi:hypothetical protein